MRARMRAYSFSTGIVGVLAFAVSCSSADSDTSGVDANVPSDSASRADASSPPSGTLGPHGGSVTTLDGTGVVVPEGALASEMTITVESAPNPPKVSSSEGQSVGQTFLFRPEGAQFLSPVTVTLAFDASGLPASKTANDIVILGSPSASQSYAALATKVSQDGHHVQARTNAFGFFVPILPYEPKDASAEASNDSSLEHEDAGTSYDAGSVADATATADGSPAADATSADATSQDVTSQDVTSQDVTSQDVTSASEGGTSDAAQDTSPDTSDGTCTYPQLSCTEVPAQGIGCCVPPGSNVTQCRFTDAGCETFCSCVANGAPGNGTVTCATMCN